MNCDRPHCTGQIDADGYCDVCGKKATQAGRLSQALDIGAADVPVDETLLTRRALTTRRTSTRRARTSDAIVDIPTVPPRDPASAVLANPEVPEERRYCAQCNGPVGRSRAGTPGRTEGFCPRCGHPFSFRPKLAAGDLVARQYDVAGCIAHGGLGWIYLAKDRNVEDRWVVLKGLLNTSDEDARGAALSEKRFLAGVNHPNIVKIYNFVEHGNDGYIVMEFVDGTSLRGLLEARREANGGEFDYSSLAGFRVARDLP